MRGTVAIVMLVVGLVIGGLIGRFALGPAGVDTSVATREMPPAEEAAPAAAPVRWKLASAYAHSTAVLGESVDVFLGSLDAMSGGDIELRFFEPGALVPALEVFDAVSSGSVEAGYSTPGFWAGKEPALQLFAAVPFGPAAPEYMAWYYEGGGEALLDEIYAGHNIKGLLCGLFPPEASGWFREPINGPDDLKGLKMRFFALGARVMEKLGVSTQLLAGGDIFPALELGTIDATEYASPAIDQNLGFYQVAKHYYFPGWHQQSTWVEIIINLDKWNGLSDTQRAMFETACGDMVRYSIALGEAAQVPAMEFLEKQGVVFHKWPPEMLDLFRSAWTEVVADEVAKDETFAKVWTSLKDFRTRYATWRELGYLD
jgi:TRAP-type mannitol/chloroaromatic compound transport system substrate-binding protein